MAWFLATQMPRTNTDQSDSLSASDVLVSAGRDDLLSGNINVSNLRTEEGLTEQQIASLDKWPKDSKIRWNRRLNNRLMNPKSDDTWRFYVDPTTNEVIGYFEVVKAKDSHMVLSGLTVHPYYRKLELGKQLLRWQLEQSIKQNTQGKDLEIEHAVLATRNLLRKLGLLPLKETFNGVGIFKKKWTYDDEFYHFTVVKEGILSLILNFIFNNHSSAGELTIFLSPETAQLLVAAGPGQPRASVLTGYNKQEVIRQVRRKGRLSPLTRCRNWQIL